MRYRLILALALAFVALAPLTPAVKPVEARTGLTLALYCIPLGRNRAECHADVYGGTAPYTYQWSPTPLIGGGELAIMPCARTPLNVSVTVTDANNNNIGDSIQFYNCNSDPW